MMIVQMCHFMIVHFIGIYSLCSVCVCACVRAYVLGVKQYGPMLHCVLCLNILPYCNILLDFGKKTFHMGIWMK